MSRAGSSSNGPSFSSSSSSFTSSFPSSSSSSSPGLTLLELKLRAKAREETDKVAAARKRNCLLLVQQFCLHAGYTETAARLQTESGIGTGNTANKWQLADNVELGQIVQEYEEYFKLKYGREPKLVRYAGPGGENDGGDRDNHGNSRKRNTSITRPSSFPSIPIASGLSSSVPTALPASVQSAFSYSDSTANADAPLFDSASSDRGGKEKTDKDRDRDRDRDSEPRASSASSSNSLKKSSSQNKSNQKNSSEKSASGKGKSRNKNENGIGTATANGNESVNGNEVGVGAILDMSISGTRTANNTREANSNSASSASSTKPTASSHSSSSSPSSVSSSNSSHPHPPLHPPIPPSALRSSPLSDSPSSSSSSSSSVSISSFPSSLSSSSFSSSSSSPSSSSVIVSPDPNSFHDCRTLKPLPNFGSTQLNELASIITRDIFSSNPNVRWSSIAELDSAKQLLQEAVVMPIRFPQFFTGLLSPWKGILLYGPPGTGKTLLARAVATECRTTFFNISASTIVSKYRGESEKLVRVLFDLARYHAPSTIFIDEIDALMGRRDGGEGGEHEGSRRMKTELLIQMDGLAQSDALVFVLAASNLPWDLDIALLRRLEKRILVPLPNEKGRLIIIQQHLLREGRSEDDINWTDWARRTEGYSGADLMLLCKEAAMRPVRRLMKELMKVETNEEMLKEGAVDSEVKLDLVSEEDLESALKCTRPSAAVKYLKKYDEWHREYGASIET